MLLWPSVGCVRWGVFGGVCSVGCVRWGVFGGVCSVGCVLWGVFSCVHPVQIVPCISESPNAAVAVCGVCSVGCVWWCVFGVVCGGVCSVGCVRWCAPCTDCRLTVRVSGREGAAAAAGGAQQTELQCDVGARRAGPRAQHQPV